MLQNCETLEVGLWEMKKVLSQSILDNVILPKFLATSEL